MGLLDKEAYERKREWAAKRMTENSLIDSLAPEQHEVLSWLCSVRHDVHCNQEAFWYSEYSGHSEYWDYINYIINDKLKSVNLPCIEWSFSPDDYMTDSICYELGYDDDEIEEEMKNCFNMSNIFNNDIEHFLLKFDKEHGTNYCPSGFTR